MTEKEKEIEAIRLLSHKAKIVGEYRGFIVLGQCERDYYTKCRHIDRGNTHGFYTVESALAEYKFKNN